MTTEILTALVHAYLLGLKSFNSDQSRLQTWLETKNPYFGGKKPIEVMDTLEGIEEVEDELSNIEYSAFS